nr:L-xylulose 5-phosphate 3-epimerase [Raoultella sp. NCTC 9187]
MCRLVKDALISSMSSATLQNLNYRGAFLIEMWTEKAKEPVLEIIQARRWIEARMEEGGFVC